MGGRLNTYVPENVRFLIRYGPQVLDPDTYRRQLRFELRRYLWFHLRQLPKPSRLTDPEFFAVHGQEIEAILRESGGDADVRSAMLRRQDDAPPRPRAPARRDGTALSRGRHHRT